MARATLLSENRFALFFYKGERSFLVDEADLRVLRGRFGTFRDEPDEVRRFEKGRFEIIKIAGMVIGRATDTSYRQIKSDLKTVFCPKEVAVKNS